MIIRTVRHSAWLAVPIVCALALTWAVLATGVAEGSLGELSFLGCLGQLKGCATLPGAFTGAVERPKGLAVSPDGGNVYAADADANSIDVFSRNTLTGALTMTECVGQHSGCAATAPAAAVESPFAVAVSPDGRSVYAVSTKSNALVEFSRDIATGALTYTGCIGQLSGCVRTTPTEAIDGPGSLVVSADGTSVYVASENAGGAVDEFARNTDNGALSFSGCIGAGGCSVPSIGEALRLADAVAISPDGSNVYVGGQGASISTFTRNTSTGALTFQGCAGNSNVCVQPNPLAVNEPGSLAVSPDGANLYAGNFANGTVDVFSRNASTGALTFTGCDGALSGDPGACTEIARSNPAGPLTVAVSPDGADVYVSAEQGVYEYTRGSAGALTFAECVGNAPGVCAPTVPEEALAFTESLALSPNGASLYAGAQLAQDIDVFGRTTFPVCDNTFTTVPYGTPTQLTLTCGDADGKPLTYTIVSASAHGTLGTPTAGGQVIYTPADGYSGPDSFTFTATNADGTAVPASAELTVAQSSGGTTTGNTGPPSTYVPPPSTPTAPELALKCPTRSLVLTDVLRRGSRVLLYGAGAKSLAGKQVRIFLDGHAHVSSAVIAANGLFSATAPLPGAKLRSSASYLAAVGALKSPPVTLLRRLVLDPPTSTAGKVTLVGEVVKPLADPVAKIVVSQRVSCDTPMKVAEVKPGAGGAFRITLTAPSGQRAALYSLATMVRVRASSRHLVKVMSLPEAVELG
jgi:DNA-binding beta-propeller fold protein YncE